jgi:hypothetical protein
MSANQMNQTAPSPDLLFDLVKRASYRPGWMLMLSDIDRGQGSKGLTLQVYGKFPDTNHPEITINVVHYFPVPPAAYNEQSWRRWLFDRLLEVERHEAAEFFRIDGKQPYAPHHGPGNDPYIIFEHGSDEDRRTDFRGVVHSH